MKAYCMNCGHPSEYSATPPKKCEKCGIEFAKAKIEFTLRIQPDEDKKSRPVKEVIAQQLEDSDFDSFMESEPEAFSEDEIQGIFLKNSDRGITFKDMVAEAAAEIAAGKTKPKIKKRIARSSHLRKKK